MPKKAYFSIEIVLDPNTPNLHAAEQSMSQAKNV